MIIAVRYYTQTGNTKKLADAIAADAGIPLSEREFHCKGSFKMMHGGKPDDADIAAVKRFAREIVG